jgi:hypothetical protein
MDIIVNVYYYYIFILLNLGFLAGTIILFWFLDAIKYHYNCHISNIISRGNLVLHLSGIRIIYRHMITFRFTWYFEIDEIYISIQIGQHMHHITRQKIWIPQLCPVHSIIKVALEIHNYLLLLIFVDIFMWIIYIKYR